MATPGVFNFIGADQRTGWLPPEIEGCEGVRPDRSRCGAVPILD